MNTVPNGQPRRLLGVMNKTLLNTIKSKIMKKTSQDEKNNSGDIIKSLIDAMSMNDAKIIRSLFHDDAKQAYGNGSWKSGEVFFNWLQSDIIDRKGHVDHANFSINGKEVVVTGQYSSEGYTNKANFLFSVENGKIVSWQMRY